MTGVYLQFSTDRIKATAGLLRRLRAFVRSSCDLMANPAAGSTIVSSDYLTRSDAQRLLTWLVNVAVCRKTDGFFEDIRLDDRYAGWVRDQRRLFDIRSSRLRVYQFETPEVRERFADLLASHDD